MRKITNCIIVGFSLYISMYALVSAEISADITLNPENPLPKSAVTLRLESYSFDVNTAVITWLRGGNVVLKGQGERSLTIKTGGVGEASVIVVKAETSDGSFIQQSITITPSSVILLYEAPKSYVPLLYKGRSLPSDGALIRVSAIPAISDGGVALSPQNVSYTWYMNDSVVPGVSGLGKQAATFRLDYLNTYDSIKVIVRSPGGNAATKTINVYPHAILPLLYPYNELFGPDFTSLLGRRFETTKEFTLSLEPLYISTQEEKDATYSWFLDGLPATPEGGRVLSLRPNEDSYGTRMLSISMTGPDRRIQEASTKMEIIFDTRK